MRSILTGILLVAAVWPGTSQGQIIINEVLPSPGGNQEEFIELLNAGDEPVQVGAISFRDSRSDWIPADAGSSAHLAPDELLVLTAGAQPSWPDVDFQHPAGWASLNNSGDSVLVRVGARVTDRVGYTDNERGKSLERLDPAVPGHVAGNWASSDDISGGSPGRINTRYRPDDTPPRLLAAEFAPPSGLFLWLSEPVDPGSIGDLRLRVDGRATGDGAVLQGSAQLHVPLEAAHAPSLIAAGGLNDFAGHAMPDTTVSVAIPATPGDAFLSELLVETRSGPNDLPEFVEIATRSDRPISLRRAVLTIGAGPEPDVTSFSPSDSTRIIDPGAVLLVYASPSSGEAAVHLRTLVEDALDTRHRRVEIVAANPSDLALRNAGDLVRIVSAEGDGIDGVEYGPDTKDIRFGDHRGRSIRRIQLSGVDGPKWASTLEDTGVTPGTHDLSNASGSEPEPGDLVFSELMPRPLGDQPEYIEVANVSGRTMDLNGLVLGSGDTRRIIFQPLVLAPGRVAVVYELPNAVGDAASEQFDAIAEAFPPAYSAGVGFGQFEASLGRGEFLPDGHGLLIPVRGAIGLKDDGEILRLMSAGGVVLDSVAYSPAMHHPAVVDPTGRALERTVLSPTPLRLGAWSTSVTPGGGSPGLVPQRPGPPPSRPDAGLRVRLEPKTISPDGDGIDDRTIILAENLEHGTVVRVDVYDIDGRLVRSLESGTIADGTFSAEWSGLDDESRPVARGFYVALVRTASADQRGARAFRLPLAVLR